MKKIKLGDLVRIRTGKLDANASSSNGQYPFFTCSRTPLRINSYSYDCECVLVAGNGDLNVKYYSGKFDAYQRTYIIESMDDKVLDTRYLYWFLFKYVEKLRELAIGGVIKYIKLNNLTDPQVDLPEISKQKEIVELLDKSNSLIDKRKHSISLIDVYLESKFDEMFGNLDTNTHGWKISTLSSLTKKVTDGTHQPPKFVSDGIPFIFISNIVNNEIILKTKKFISEDTYKFLTKSTPIEIGDILYTTVGSYGHPAIIKSSDKFCFQRHIAHIKPDTNKIDTLFLYGMLKSPMVRRQADEKAKGIAQKTLNLSDLKNIKVFVPPIELQNIYVDLVRKSEILKQKMVIQSEELENHLQALMQKTFN